MTTKEAVAWRIIELCNERGIAINTLANIFGMPPATVYSMLNQKKQKPRRRVHQKAVRRA